MSEKKVGKRLLTWVLVLIMALSMLPLNVLANEDGGDSVVYGHNDGSGWVEDDGTGTDPITNVPGVDSVSKTAVRVGAPEDNTYQVTLQVQMHTSTTTHTHYDQAATVLVIDTSGSMSYCLQPEHKHTASCYTSTGVPCDNLIHYDLDKNGVYQHYDGSGTCIEVDETYYEATLNCGLTNHTHHTGCGGGNDRLATAKIAAIDFLNSYRADDGTGRYVALVSFRKSATVARAGWQNVSTNAGYTAILNAINNLEADGGTNLDDGLQTANQLFAEPVVQGIGSKNIIALTDGKPTYYMGTDWLGSPDVKGNGKDCSEKVFKATESTAASIRNGGTTLYSICFGAANEEVKDPYTDTNISLFNYLNTYIAPSKTYAANDFSALKAAFEAISSSITSVLSSGTVHDSLPTGVTSTEIPGGTAVWDLNTFDKKESTAGTEGNTTTTYTYTKTYTVQIDPSEAGKSDGEYCPLNGPTTLKVKGSNDKDVDIPFPIPAGKVTLPTYTVTYNLDGGTTTSDTTTFSDLTYGVDTPTIANPTKDGYTFAGWEPTFAEKVTGNATYKAKWTQDKYTVTYNLDGGTTTSDTTTFSDLTYGVDTPTIANPTKDGYTFAGWEPTFAEKVTGNATYKAKWTQDKYTVTYNLDGGTTTSEKTTFPDLTYGVETPTINEPTKAGYTFAGWEPTVAEKVTGNATYKAQWTQDKYTVTYNLDGGNTTSEKTTFPDLTYGVETPTINEPTKAGYTFAGWEPKVAETVTKDVTYKAKWNAIYVPYYPPAPPTVKIEDDDALGLNTTDHFAYIVGYGNGEVRPQNNITRAEVATIFFRLLTDDVRDENLTKTNRYSDVAATSWYNTAVSTLSSMGIITGYPDGTFRPNAAITRAEFAAIAARFDNDGDKTAAKFSDIASHWAKDEISIAYNNGWITGYPDGTFGPQRDITRAETMTLVNRVLNRQPETEDDLLPNMTVWTDNANPKAWYYLAVQEATNSHYYKFKTNSKYEKWTELRETRDWTLLEK